MTALVPAGGARVLRLLPVPSRGTARTTDVAGRHTIAPGRQAATLYLVPQSRPRPRELRGHGVHGLGRHRAPVPRAISGTRPAHAALNRYDRLLFWFAGTLLNLRVAVVGERVVGDR